MRLIFKFIELIDSIFYETYITLMHAIVCGHRSYSSHYSYTVQLSKQIYMRPIELWSA